MSNQLFSGIRAIKTYDPLSQLLGATDDGVLEYGYYDCVKLAGHSCPTVAGAYLMTLRALERLYPGALPVRGDMRVEVSGPKDEGTNGVIANVASFITGACDEGGFKGLNGAFARNNRLGFGRGFDGSLAFTRLDNGASVVAAYNPSSVPPSPDMQSLMRAYFLGSATAEQTRAFGQVWQDRVIRILRAELSAGGLVVLSD